MFFHFSLIVLTKKTKRMIRLWLACLQLAELFVSSLVHLLYGFYIFSSAVAGDLSQALNEMFFKSNVNIEVKEDVSDERAVNVDNLPPIVLVHGIFGFGKGVCSFSEMGLCVWGVTFLGCSDCFHCFCLNWVCLFFL